MRRAEFFLSSHGRKKLSADETYPPKHNFRHFWRGLLRVPITPGSKRKLKNSPTGRELRDNGRRNLQREEKYMRRARSILSACMLVLAVATVALAQDIGRVNGEIRDKDGNPYPDVTVVMKNTESGQAYTDKTDKNGKFVQLGMKAGIYVITSTNAKDNFNFSEKFQVVLDHDNDYKLNMKEVIAQSGPSAEEQKKQADQAEKFKNMKVHFDNGVKSMTEANDLRTQLRTAAADQKSALQEKRMADCQTAAIEFSDAEQGIGAKDVKNHAMVLGNLGAADECEAKFDDASAAFQKAIDLQPTAGYYTGLATNDANAGAASTDKTVSAAKFADASAACDKAIALDPAAGATCWKNLGIVLSNKGRMQEAIVPLQKATTADPKDAQSWLMLGNAMTATIVPKAEGDKMTYIIPPGTQEAYQKAIDLAPGTPVAKQAQDGIDGLTALSGGQDTSVGKKKKK
jgi:tetratricopeptide (TPR) repeat protein